MPEDTVCRCGALVDETLESLLDNAVEQFTQAAEDFVAATAKRLGLTEVFITEDGVGLAP